MGQYSNLTSTSPFQYLFFQTMSQLVILVILSTGSILVKAKHFLIETDDVGDALDTLTIPNNEVGSVIEDNLTDVMIHEDEDYKKRRKRKRRKRKKKNKKTKKKRKLNCDAMDGGTEYFCQCLGLCQ